ncbi:hypothetical protein FPH17_05080 [Corynebacterium godavarianum]|uniref:Uncharacterized protein n=1 Tax=Corynebacterium godavarianum TaxID=2054421 RepID=A0ABY3E568_9CORY|nr:hypothetical protein FPH17_05080 [Corynebacterium godavarianum]
MLPKGCACSPIPAWRPGCAAPRASRRGLASAARAPRSPGRGRSASCCSSTGSLRRTDSDRIPWRGGAGRARPGGIRLGAGNLTHSRH